MLATCTSIFGDGGWVAKLDAPIGWVAAGGPRALQRHRMVVSWKGLLLCDGDDVIVGVAIGRGLGVAFCP